ncbi:hypothetical protein PsJ27TS7_14980 [Paenibacillus dendritiformis]
MKERRSGYLNGWENEGKTCGRPERLGPINERRSRRHPEGWKDNHKAGSGKGDLAVSLIDQFSQQLHFVTYLVTKSWMRFQI